MRLKTDITTERTMQPFIEVPPASEPFDWPDESGFWANMRRMARQLDVEVVEVFEPHKDPTSAGRYRHSTRTIEMHTYYNWDTRLIVLHEMIHAVDHYLGTLQTEAHWSEVNRVMARNEWVAEQATIYVAGPAGLELAGELFDVVYDRMELAAEYAEPLPWAEMEAVVDLFTRTLGPRYTGH